MTTSGPRNLMSVKSLLSENDYLQAPKTNKQFFTANTIWRVLWYKILQTTTRLMKSQRILPAVYVPSLAGVKIAAAGQRSCFDRNHAMLTSMEKYGKTIFFLLLFVVVCKKGRHYALPRKASMPEIISSLS